jgi:gas vesicle protein
MANTHRLETLGVLMAGAGIGAAVTLLYAPKTGKQTRKQLQKHANKALDRLDDLQDGFRSYVTEWVDEASESIEAGIASGKHTAKESSERVIRALESARTYMDDGMLRVERYVESLAR